MLPNETLAASLLPCLDEVMELHCLLLPGDAVFSVHVAPEFVEVQTFPPQIQAVSLVPSLDEVMDCQFCVFPTEVSSVHVAPESVEVQMFPL